MCKRIPKRVLLTAGFVAHFLVFPDLAVRYDVRSHIYDVKIGVLYFFTLCLRQRNLY